MKFILHEIKLWFQDRTTEPRTFKFEPNKINVITGGATTGKTSIWNIIDYCLLSNRIKIANIINDLVGWYGISFSINNKEFAIARKTPERNTASADIWFDENGIFPDHLYSNYPIQELRAKLDIEFGITNEVRFPFGKQSESTKFNISYRYFLLFNTLTEDIMGSNQTYFDTVLFGKKEYEKALPIIFNLAIGVNDMRNIKAKEKVEEIKKEIKSLERKQKKREKEETDYKINIYNLLNTCKLKGFIEYNDNNLPISDALQIIQNIINNYKGLAQNKNLFNELDLLNQQKSKIKSQLFAISKYEREYDLYEKNLNKVSDSLKPIELLSSRFKDQIIDSYETQSFIKLLEDSLLEIKNNSNKIKTSPLKIDNDIKKLKSELKLIEDKILSYDKIKKSYQTELEKYIFIGEIKNEFHRINDREKIEPINVIKLNALIDEKQKVEEIPKENDKVKSILKNKLNDCIQHIYKKVTSMPKYKDCKTLFNEDEMVLQLLPPDDFFPITNVGSKSNYMFMQLCFYLGFHNHMISVGQIHVPQFLFIDQLSIPYYSGEEGNIKNKDKEKLLNAFSILNDFITEINQSHNADFQIIMVEHAPKEYWENNGLTNFKTVDEFINGNGLIPQKIYNEKQNYNQ